MNKKVIARIVATQAVLLAVPKVQKELRALKEIKSRKRIQSIWSSEGEAEAYALDRKAFDQYLDDLASFYETPQSARRKYSANIQFNNIIRNL